MSHKTQVYSSSCSRAWWCVLLFCTVLFGLPDKPAAEEALPRIELYTMGVGDSIPSSFGHAALCVFDAKNPKGSCYNYGMTDFSRGSALLWDQMQGKAIFWVKKMGLRKMVKVYRRHNRTVWRQTLPLSPQALAALSQKLEHDVQPENREYIYHHFDDNCATRLRDQINQATDGLLKERTSQTTDRVWRDHVRRGFARHFGVLVASDLMMTRAMDQPLTRWQELGMPYALRAEVTKHLGAQPVVVFERQAPPAPPPGRTTGFLAIVALALTLPCALWIHKSAGQPPRWALLPPLVMLVGIAVLIGLLAILCSIPDIRHNEALLVWLPTDLAWVWLPARWRVRYILARLAGLAVVGALLLAGALVQPLTWSLVAVALLWVAPLLYTRRRLQHEGAKSDTTAQPEPGA